jgi:hypothetical protein
MRLCKKSQGGSSTQDVNKHKILEEKRRYFPKKQKILPYGKLALLEK